MSDPNGLILTHVNGGAICVFFNAACAPVMYAKEMYLPFWRDAVATLTEDFRSYAEHIKLDLKGQDIFMSHSSSRVDNQITGMQWQLAETDVSIGKTISSWKNDRPTVEGTVVIVPGIETNINVVHTLEEIMSALKDGVTSLHDPARFQRLVSEGSKPIAEKLLSDGKDKLDELQFDQTVHTVPRDYGHYDPF